MVFQITHLSENEVICCDDSSFRIGVVLRELISRRIDLIEFICGIGNQAALKYKLEGLDVLSIKALTQTSV